jgi:hypothetical protein
MAVRRKCHPGSEINAHLDDLASRNAQIVLHEIGALDFRLLRPCRMQRQTACDDQNR